MTEAAPALVFRTLVLLFDSQQESDKIIPFLSESVDPALLSRQDYLDMFEFGIGLLAKRGRWNDAQLLAEKLNQTVRANTGSKTNTFGNDNSSLYHIRAPLMVAKNDVEGYRRVCGEIISQFSNATDYAIANRMAKDCLILPSSGVDLGPVAALAELAVSPGAKISFGPFCSMLQSAGRVPPGPLRGSCSMGRPRSQEFHPSCSGAGDCHPGHEPIQAQ